EAEPTRGKEIQICWERAAMNSRTVLTAFLVGICTAGATPTPAVAGVTPNVHFDVREEKLDNGLRILLLEDHSAPAFTFWTFYQVGSINERPGITGISHLFEHMMFRGAKKYGPGELDRTMESAGGRNNAFTSKDETAYYDEIAAGQLPLICDLESDRMAS